MREEEDGRAGGERRNALATPQGNGAGEDGGIGASERCSEAEEGVRAAGAEEGVGQSLVAIRSLDEDLRPAESVSFVLYPAYGMEAFLPFDREVTVEGERLSVKA
jgi:hypothetical protein